MSAIDQLYRSSRIFNQSAPTTDTFNTTFNYSIAQNLYGSDVLLYTGLIPTVNPLVSSGDGAKYSVGGIEIVEKIDKEVLSTVEESFFAFGDSRLTYIIPPGSSYAITLWSKDENGDYTVVVPSSFYDVFYYEKTQSYVIYFNERYAPIYTNGSLDNPAYPPAITCYRYCGPKGIENLPSGGDAGIVFVPDVDMADPGTGIYSSLDENPGQWMFSATSQTGVTVDSSLYPYTNLLYDKWSIMAFDFGTHAAVGDFASPFMVQTADGTNWVTRDLIAEGGHGHLRTIYNVSITQDPGTHEVYVFKTLLNDVAIKFDSTSSSIAHVPLEFVQTNPTIRSILSCNGVFSILAEDGSANINMIYTDDFSTFNVVTGDLPTISTGTPRHYIVDPGTNRVWMNMRDNSSTTGYISTDNGISYSSFIAPFALNVSTQLLYNNGVYVIADRLSTNTIYTSTDLENWTLAPVSDVYACQTVGTGIWFAFTVDNVVYISSDDAETWQTVTIPIDPGFFGFDALKIGSTYYITCVSDGYSVSLLSSTDLENWTVETEFTYAGGGQYNPPQIQEYYRWSIFDSSQNIYGSINAFLYAVVDGNIIFPTVDGYHYKNGSSWVTTTEDTYSLPYYGLLKI